MILLSQFRLFCVIYNKAYNTHHTHYNALGGAAVAKSSEFITSDTRARDGGRKGQDESKTTVFVESPL